ncbi:MAG: hypothetical protein IMF11_17390 [Proteobacteria bacterium]|nr:hypothetical protein [Pseudomonadota bacterium]
MLITPDKLKLAKYLDRGSRLHALDSLLFDQNKVVVSNGYYLIQVEDTPPPYEDFPVIKEMAEGEDYTPDKILVTANTATKVLKNLPKSKTLPILNNALIGADKDGNVSFGLTNLDSSIVVRQRKEEGEYPDADAYIRDNTKDKPKATADVNVKYLQKTVGARR